MLFAIPEGQATGRRYAGSPTFATGKLTEHDVPKMPGGNYGERDCKSQIKNTRNGRSLTERNGIKSDCRIARTSIYAGAYNLSKYGGGVSQWICRCAEDGDTARLQGVPHRRGRPTTITWLGPRGITPHTADRRGPDAGSRRSHITNKVRLCGEVVAYRYNIKKECQTTPRPKGCCGERVGMTSDCTAFSRCIVGYRQDRAIPTILPRSRAVAVGLPDGRGHLLRRICPSLPPSGRRSGRLLPIKNRRRITRQRQNEIVNFKICMTCRITAAWIGIDANVYMIHGTIDFMLTCLIS